MKKTVLYNADRLPAAQRDRLAQLMPVAVKRSIARWESALPAVADVIFSASADAACVQIQMSDATHLPSGHQPITVPTEFRLAALMDALDLAAVRVMNARDSGARSLTSTTGTSAAPLAWRYGLTFWAVPGQRAPLALLRVLAVMTRRSVTREWIRDQGQLNDIQTDAFLADLELRGALRKTALTAGHSATGATLAVAPAGLLQRLRSWLRGDRQNALALMT